ncbi:MAG TPA: xanthine dehydrogenase family protein subunit M [Thermodesulfobacteriota bacterium]|nr:xanthine dehydrogenase family protein subunit M [Thermodesulfobacteriota bacterium]
MTPPKVLTARSVKEAVSFLSEYGEKARFISGATDLSMQLKRGEAAPECLIRLGEVRELDFITHDESGGLRVGALTTVGEVANSPLIRSKFSILAQAAGMLGTPAVRNQATLGGNLCNAAPSADTAPPLLVLGAAVKIVGKGGEKIVPLEDFFVGPGQTILGRDRLLTEIRVPNIPAHSGGAYLKQKRRQGADLAVVGVAALVVMRGEVLEDVKIALGAVAPTPIRARKAEEILRGRRADPDLLEKSSQTAVGEASPIDDIRGSADYRRELLAVLTKRAVVQAIQQAEGR